MNHEGTKWIEVHEAIILIAFFVVFDFIVPFVV